MIKLRNSIGLRLLRYVFACYLVVAVAVTGIQLVFEYRHVKSNLFTQLYGLEVTFKDSIVTSLWSFDTPQLKATLFGMQKIDMVSGIKIVNQQQETIASTGAVLTKESQIVSTKHLAHNGMVETTLIQPNTTTKQTLFEYRFPIEYQEDKDSPATLLGYGLIYASENTIIERVKYSFILIIINSVIKTLALWLFFLFFANRVIGRPLKALAKAASALNPDKRGTLGSSKEFDTIIDAKHKDELYLLADNFNQMRVAILEKIDIIESQKQTLEKSVAERTESLTEANADLQHLVLHDTLTSLPNRTLFNDRLDQMLKTAARNKTRFIVACIDLENFKTVNDTYGHQIGDQILAGVAGRMSKVLRTADTLARVGGDEFFALLPIANASDSEVIAEHLHSSLYEPFIFENDGSTRIFTNANIGTAIYPEHGESAEALIKNADMAMYQAKQSGINYANYNSEEDSILRRQVKISQDIKPAIEEGQFYLVYQPILEYKTKRVTKLEALIRWQHPTFGLLSPVEFIPIAERNGNISELTQWVLKTTCKQCKQYQLLDSSMSVSVNISGRVFNQPEMPDLLEKICMTSDVSPSRINLEITETTAMAKPEQAINILHQLTGKGFTVSIDDFGTGYSSFSYLTELSVNELKIDKSFLLSMNVNRNKVIKAMIDLAHSLDLKVVAEGIETKELLDMLSEMNCDFAQGFYIAKPLPIEVLYQWLLSVEKNNLF
ncbi:putative bifunctional diguanylate cyclase/phosphodiesterase [Neptunomonas antarctica]|uniref:Diguanylate cyclase (GGDEF) domain-containing protein n=1 Tax=Neptunomonas antarctica TaxID=619304 RepID=A0A1N7NUZ2_9GAMM|nr:GGDEF domain-containing phosphodiesterase [Neptunomonas antarctica]SIT02121.1 diguanylate cyclase (GGDEF) domain-containing protein [Neptunomonas antarctica]